VSIDQTKTNTTGTIEVIGFKGLGYIMSKAWKLMENVNGNNSASLSQTKVNMTRTSEVMGFKGFSVSSRVRYIG
jgi:hypothetical protein